MADLLVNLLNLPERAPTLAALGPQNVIVRRARTFEATPAQLFVAENFSRNWADEISVGFYRQPVSIFLATIDKKLVGFAAYECTARAYFGPEGVAPEYRRRGVGKALLLSALWGLRELGYVYGIIGGAGPVEFYERCVGAIVIPGSDPGLYTDKLKG